MEAEKTVKTGRTYDRVFLIEPKYPGSFYQSPVWPLGLGYIAEALDRTGMQYKVIDLGFDYSSRILYNTIRAFRPGLIAVRLMSSKTKQHYALIRQLKHSFPEISIIVGGPHVSILREKVLTECPEIDFAVVGDGEESIVELCRGKDLASIKGLLWRRGSNVVYNGERKNVSELDSIPFPTYKGFELSKYDTKFMNILSSRGCPHSCIYCCVGSMSGRQWRARSPKNVVDEIEYWYKRGYRVFNFMDDAFNIDRKRVLGICDEIEKRGLRIELNAPNGIRADRADRELLARMKEVGFKKIAFGVEAGNNKVLSNIKKGETIEEIEEAIKDACSLGFDVNLFFLIGSPGETESDIEDSFRLATKYPVTDVCFYNLIPFPRTELYDWIKRNGYFVRLEEEYFNDNMMWTNKPVFFTPELSEEKRKEIYARGIKLGGKLRKNYLYKYYQGGFRKFGIFAKPLAYIASRSLFQALLRNSKILRSLRITVKRRGLFSRYLENR